MHSTKGQDITGIILVGRKSRRMGRDKEFLEIAGMNLFERVLDIFMNNFESVALVGDRDGTAFLNVNTPEDFAKIGGEQ